MKLWVGVALIILALMGCELVQTPGELDEIVTSTHALRKMVSQTTSNGRVQGSFFLLVGGIEGTTTTSTKLQFAWRVSDTSSTYIISTIPLENVRVRIDSAAIAPSVTFTSKHSGYDERDQLKRFIHAPQVFMDQLLWHATVTVREEDWPVRIEPPLNE